MKQEEKKTRTVLLYILPLCEPKSFVAFFCSLLHVFDLPNVIHFQLFCLCVSLHVTSQKLLDTNAVAFPQGENKEKMCVVYVCIRMCVVNEHVSLKFTFPSLTYLSA